LIAYTGDTRSRNLLAVLREEGIGQMVIRGRLAGRRLEPWAYDNGAFEDWRAGRPFDRQQFLLDLQAIAVCTSEPDFVVLPDRVAAGSESLDLSLEWRHLLKREGLDLWPLYLAVQDGMQPTGIPWSEFDGIFIGGTAEWKTRTAQQWVITAHEHGLPCHYARCGTGRKVRHAKGIRADSIDSSLPLWSRDNLRQFLRAMRQETLIFD
jgi:hypothetical protein